MKAGWTEVALGNVIAEARSGFAHGGDVPDGVLQVRMHNVSTHGTLDFSKQRRVPRDARTSSFALKTGDVLFNATNSPELVGKTALFREREEPVVFSNHFLRLRVNEQRVIPEYLARWMQYQHRRGVYRGLAQQWVHQAAVRTERLLSSTFPLPPLDEQRRIARVLDRASALHSACVRGDDVLGELRRECVSSFLRTGGFEPVPLADILVGPAGNGISPSASGTYPGSVLTLSALRRETFDAGAQKSCVFATPPAARQMVTRGTFLVSRGNGNLSLVGRGSVVPSDLPGVAFPDTMIGVRLDTDRVCLEFIEAVWSLPVVRGQIERAATTTSGIYKINQSKLSAVKVPLPARKIQEQLARTLRAIMVQKRRGLAYLAESDALLTSLQHRAFTGAL